MPEMKLLIFVVDDAHADPAVDALVEQNIRVTRLATTGGFLRRGNTTMLIGVESGQVERVKAIMRKAAPGALAVSLDMERYERL